MVTHADETRHTYRQRTAQRCVLGFEEIGHLALQLVVHFVGVYARKYCGTYDIQTNALTIFWVVDSLCALI